MCGLFILYVNNNPPFCYQTTRERKNSPISLSARAKEESSKATLDTHKQLPETNTMIETSDPRRLSSTRSPPSKAAGTTSVDPIPRRYLLSTPGTTELLLSPPSQMPLVYAFRDLIINSHTRRYPPGHLEGLTIHPSGSNQKSPHSSGIFSAPKYQRGCRTDPQIGQTSSNSSFGGTFKLL